MEKRDQVRKFCLALMNNNLSELLRLFSRDPVVSWGPYRFQGKEEIRRWASELGEMFPELFISEKLMEIEGDQARHEFLIESVTRDGRRAWLPCVGTYELEGRRIRSLNIQLLRGWMAVKREDLEDASPHSSTTR